MQYDAGVIVDPTTNLVTHINGKPLDANKLYNVGYPIAELTAENGPKATTNYFLNNPVNKRHLHSTARGGQEFLLQYWAHQIWLAVWNKLDRDHDGSVSKEEFNEIDKNGDGDISEKELMEFMKKELGMEYHPGEPNFATHVLLEGGDGNKDGRLTWNEFKQKEKASSEERRK